MQNTVGGDPVVTDWTIGSNGLVKYGSAAARVDNPSEKLRQEKFWRSLGKKIRKGSRIK